MSQTIQDIIAKCEEIEKQTAFVRTLAGKATDPEWELNDPNYTHALAVYTSAKAKLVLLVSQLP